LDRKSVCGFQSSTRRRAHVQVERVGRTPLQGTFYVHDCRKWACWTTTSFAWTRSSIAKGIVSVYVGKGGQTSTIVGSRNVPCWSRDEGLFRAIAKQLGPERFSGEPSPAIQEPITLPVTISRNWMESGFGQSLIAYCIRSMNIKDDLLCRIPWALSEDSTRAMNVEDEMTISNRGVESDERDVALATHTRQV